MVIINSLYGLPCLVIFDNALSSSLLPQLPAVAANDNTAPDFEQPEQEEQADHNGLGDGCSIGTYFRGIRARIITNTFADKSWCVVEDPIYGECTSTKADQKMYEEHGEVESDQP